MTLPTVPISSGSSSSSSSGSITGGTAGGIVLPKVEFPSQSTTNTAPTQTLNEVATSASEMQLTVAAQNAPLRIIYGRVRVGAQIANVVPWGNFWVVQAIWGEGEISGVETVHFNDEAVPAGVVQTHYLGTAGQTADATLVSAFAANGISYTDALPNIAYSVFKIPAATESGFPQIAAILNGRKVRQPWGEGEVIVFASDNTDATFANSYCYYQISAASRVILSDDYLEYEVFMSQRPSSATGSNGMEIDFADATNGRGFGLSDSYGSNIAPSSLPQGQWVSRKIALSAVAGKTSAKFMLVREHDAYGRYVAAYRNIRITNGAGTTRLTIWATGALSVSAVAYENLNSGTSVTVSSGKSYSTNPARALADFIESTVYGLGRTVNSVGFAAVASACAEYLPGTTTGRRSAGFGLAIDSTQYVTSWIDALRTYASCWVTTVGNEVLLVPDRPRSTDATYLHASGQISKIGTLKMRGVAQVPTAIEVRYTNTTDIPWREDSVFAYAAGVLAGTTPRRDSQVALPGIQTAAQAQREATERLNKLWLADLSFDLELFDDGAKIQIGDVVEVTHPIGLTAKKMRVLGVSGDYGRYRLSLSEYDPAVYSDTVVSDPTYPNTTRPNPTAPPTMGAITATEEVYQLENGNYSSRIRLSWSAPTDYVFTDHYTVEITQAGDVIDSRSVYSLTYASPPVKEGLLYVCKVAIVSTVGAVGAVAQANITAQGKLLIPAPVPVNTFQAFEAGGVVYLQWGQATDIDIWRYRIKRGKTSETYAQAVQIDLVDALRYQDKTAPVGTWRYWVDVVDSVQQESGVPRSVDVTVTNDASAFLVDSYDQTAPTLTNMALYTLAPTDANKYYVTEDAVAFGTKYSGNLSTYTNALATYHTSLTSTWLGEAEDFGMLLGGNWTGTATVSALNGSLTSYIGLSPDLSAWTYQTGLSQKANARGARLKHEALTTSTLLVTVPTQNIRLGAVPRSESGTITTSASAAATVFLENGYSAVKSIQLTVQGVAARTAVFDNVLVNGNWARTSSGYPLGRTTLNTEVPVYNSIGYEVLQLEVDQAGSAGNNNYTYWEFANATAYTTQVGDYLEFDYMTLESPDAGQTYITVYNGAWGAGTALFSATTPFNGVAQGQWGSYKMPVVATGLAITHCAITMEANAVGKHRYLLRNVRITNGSGTVRKVLWQTKADNYNVILLNNGYTGHKKSNGNAFDVYSFNGASQSADTVQWTFQGV